MRSFLEETGSFDWIKIIWDGSLGRKSSSAQKITIHKEQTRRSFIWHSQQVGLDGSLVDFPELSDVFQFF
jgi:hypothetical protein